jgi:predicted nucleic acid-binding protein
MTIKYLLVTNIVYEPLRPKPDQAVLDKLREYQSEVGTPVKDLILITFNTSDYEHFKGIQVDDWRD